MARREIRARPPWEDRFRTPTVQDLLNGFNRQQAQLVEYARKRLLEDDSVREELAWTGVPWRWTFVYRSGSDERARAYLIPQPARPQMSAPLPADAIASLEIRKLPRFVRDALVHAPQVGAARWPHWELANRTQVDDLVGLVRTVWESSAGMTV